MSPLRCKVISSLSLFLAVGCGGGAGGPGPHQLPPTQPSVVKEPGQGPKPPVSAQPSEPAEVPSAATSDAPPSVLAPPEAVKPGNMPRGATWDGVYFNPLWGYLHLQAQGGSFKGRWKRADGSAWGEMQGTLSGDVARFDWTEHKVGMVGPMATPTGKGYFRYVRPKGDLVDDTLVGEWGRGGSEVGGGAWDAVRQRNVKPDLKAVGSDTEQGW